jgi:hypothetical protein
LFFLDRDGDRRRGFAQPAQSRGVQAISGLHVRDENGA